MGKEENGFQFSTAAFSTLQLETHRKRQQNRKHFEKVFFFSIFGTSAFSTLQLYNVRHKKGDQAENARPMRRKEGWNARS